jgi:hypothetical protein
MYDAVSMFQLYVEKFVGRMGLIGIWKAQNREKIGIKRDGEEKCVYVLLKC